MLKTPYLCQNNLCNELKTQLKTILKNKYKEQSYVFLHQDTSSSMSSLRKLEQCLMIQN